MTECNKKEIMILPIYIYGQPVLRKETADITADYEGLGQLISDMFETMYKSDGIGLAAPQIGKAVRIVVVDTDIMKDDFPECAGFKKAFINGHIVEIDDTETVSMEEGCLSLPGIHESVKRATRVRIQYVDENFTPHDEWIEGYLARVIQHEFDHLDGHVFTDRISPLRKQMIRGKLTNLLKGKVHCSYKVKRNMK